MPTIVLTDSNGDEVPIQLANDPPENAVLQGVENLLSNIYSKTTSQEASIATMKSRIASIDGDTSEIITKVEALTSAVQGQSAYRDVVHIDNDVESQLSDTQDLSKTVDAVVCLSQGTLHVNTEVGERTIPVLPGLPVKCRISRIYETGTTASGIVGYIE
jgi:uncharacterized protein YoxC